MGIELPGELADLLNELGYIWPKVDEEKLVQLGQHWIDLGSTLRGTAQDANAVATAVWTDNTGQAIEAFRVGWGEQDSPMSVLRDSMVAAPVVGACLFVCAAVVLALKINVIIQLTILAIEIIQAIATAAVSFGASLLELPVFKKLADLAINFIITQAMEAILG
ncbi:MAG TPA: hypothetical protein VIR27_20665 [Mycobacteriales bacterium]